MPVESRLRGMFTKQISLTSGSRRKTGEVSATDALESSTGTAVAIPHGPSPETWRQGSAIHGGDAIRVPCWVSATSNLSANLAGDAVAKLQVHVLRKWSKRPSGQAGQSSQNRLGVGEGLNPTADLMPVAAESESPAGLATSDRPLLGLSVRVRTRACLSYGESVWSIPPPPPGASG